MRVHILGPGVVGQATGSLLTRFGNQVDYTDKGARHAAIRADIHLVCVPEAAAPEVVRNLCSKGSYQGAEWVPGVPDNEVVAIRSSVSPGTTQLLHEELKRPVFHVPEFLREATAEADVIEAEQVLIGGPVMRSGPEQEWYGRHLEILASLFTGCLKRVVVTWSTETELLKLANNAYLASQISFWNQMAAICKSVDVNSHHMARAMVANDQRVSRYGALRHGARYGGSCLPKDVEQLRIAAAEAGVPTPLLDAVVAVNDGMKEAKS